MKQLPSVYPLKASPAMKISFELFMERFRYESPQEKGDGMPRFLPEKLRDDLWGRSK